MGNLVDAAHFTNMSCHIIMMVPFGTMDFKKQPEAGPHEPGL